MMREGFLEQESKRANKRNRKLFFGLLVVYILIISVVGFVVKDSIDLNDYTTRKVFVYLTIFTVVMLVSVIVGLFLSGRAAADGSRSLILLFNEETKEEVRGRIDREAAEGKILVDEYIDTFPEGKKPRGERVVLTPSYLLLFNGMGRITVVPIDKIYWICAQTGRKGYSFIVRLVVFNEKRTLYMEGADIRHAGKIVDKIYHYIPNVFRNYDPFTLSYELDKLFDKKREEFLKFYEEEKKKMG